MCSRSTVPCVSWGRVFGLELAFTFSLEANALRAAP